MYETFNKYSQSEGKVIVNYLQHTEFPNILQYFIMEFLNNQ